MAVLGFEISGSLLVNIGGALAITAAILTLYGNHLKSEKDDSWRNDISQGQRALIDKKTNENLYSKIITVREDAIRTQLSMASRVTDIDDGIAAALEVAGTRLKLHNEKVSSLEIEKKKFEKILRPALLAFSIESQQWIDRLEKEHLITKKLYQYQPDSEWPLNGGGDLVQAKTSNGRMIHIGYSPAKFDQYKMTQPASIQLPGMGLIVITMDGVYINYPAPSQEVYVIEANDFDKPEEQKNFADAIAKAVSISIRHQLSEALGKP